MITMAKRVDTFYQGKKWLRKRQVVLKLYDYQCQETKQYGKTASAEVVHHIYPREQYPELEYVTWNLLPITSDHHNKFHDRVNDEIIGRGLYWQRKRQREFDEFYKNR